MVAFRKTFLLVAALALFASLGFAQGDNQALICNAQAATPTILRDVANADYAGDIVLRCTGGVPTVRGAEIPLVNIQVFFTLPVTSKVLGVNSLGQQLLESILIFDELRNPDNSSRKIDPCTSSHPTWNSLQGRCVVRSTGQPWNSYFGQLVPMAEDTGHKPNVFQAVSVPLATGASQVYSIAFYGVPFDPPGTLTTRTLRITNVRLQSGGFAAGGGLPPAIVASVAMQGTAPVTLMQNTATVAYVQRTMSFSTSGTRDFLQCESQTGTCPAFTLKFTELQPAAFKVRNIAVTPSALSSSVDQNIAGQFTNTEDGFRAETTWSSGSGLPGGFGGTTLAGAGVAYAGTRLLARFENVPAGVTLLATVYSKNYSTSTVDGVAKAVSVQGSTLDWNGYGGSISTSSSATVADDCTTWPGSYRGLHALRTGTVGGKNAAWGAWEVVNADANLPQSIEIGVVVNYTADTANDRPEVRDDTTVKGHLAPINSTGVPATFGTITGVPTAPAPRFNEVAASEQSGLFRIIRCRTNLLFPFVAQMGVTGKSTFDTGIAISNTSHDPFDYTSTSKPHPRAQRGACTIYYYGTTGVSDPPPAAATTAVIQPGKTYTFGLYGGSADGKIPPARDFVGYIIAVCDFQYAHGYAFISNVGAGEFAQGYVALVMDADMYDPAKGTSGARLTRTRNYSEFLDQ